MPYTSYHTSCPQFDSCHDSFFRYRTDPFWVRTDYILMYPHAKKFRVLLSVKREFECSTMTNQPFKLYSEKQSIYHWKISKTTAVIYMEIENCYKVLQWLRIFVKTGYSNMNHSTICFTYVTFVTLIKLK